MKKKYVTPCLVEYGLITECTFAFESPGQALACKVAKKKCKDKFDDSPPSSGS
jgi:hypothetical protein